ncbi:MAG TPA: 2-isopropylmalate synthase [bacterium]|nr:2-isopropylmalate synthase [bacterium]HQL63132.1 2-isopropylmalate synthase [bacterium]
MSDKIILFDTTLRDGEQAPGFSMNLQEKIEFARQLQRLKVDVIEAGFPISSPGDFESVKTIAEQIEGPQICGLARARNEDIDCCWEAVRASARPRIHTFIATSDVHVEKKLRKTRQEVKEIAVRSVERAKKYTDNVEFSTEDAARTDWDYICEVIEATINAGATTINVPDTVGYSNPWEIEKLFRYIFENVSNIRQAVVSCHCHNDLGLAVANSLATLRVGARQVECTVNGIGERAGNASLEEVVMNLKTRREFFGFETGIDTRQIYPASRMLTRFTGVSVQPNKAIVGANAFAHEAGIHQDGVLKERTTYEIMTPESVGWSGQGMVLGKHSGRHAFKTRLEELGFRLNEEELQKAFEAFKVLADVKKKVFDEDLIVIVHQQAHSADLDRYILHDLIVEVGKNGPRATVVLRSNGNTFQESGTGDGVLDAAFSVIKKITGLEESVLTNYNCSSVTQGTDAIAQSTISLRYKDKEVVGRGTDTDVVRASVKAFVDAVNRLLITEAKEPVKDIV